MLALILGHMGRLGQIGSICTPCKILTLGTEIKELAGGSFQHFILVMMIIRVKFAEIKPNDLVQQSLYTQRCQHS